MGAKTVEKIIRIQETAEKLNCPLIYLVDSAYARITDQINVFPGDAVQEEFFTIKSNYRDAFRKSVCFSDHLQQVALIFRPSVISSLW